MKRLQNFFRKGWSSISGLRLIVIVLGCCCCFFLYRIYDLQIAYPHQMRTQLGKLLLLREFIHEETDIDTLRLGQDLLDEVLVTLDFCNHTDGFRYPGGGEREEWDSIYLALLTTSDYVDMVLEQGSISDENRAVFCEMERIFRPEELYGGELVTNADTIFDRVSEEDLSQLTEKMQQEMA